MKMIIRATYWPPELKRGLPIVSIKPENVEEKNLCEEIMKQGCDYGSSFEEGGKNLVGLDVVLARIHK